MTQKKKDEWSRRIERAMDLAGRHPGTAEVLLFYGQILGFQKAAYEGIDARPAPVLENNSAFREQLDSAAAMRQLPALLGLVQKSGPPKLAQQAAAIGQSPAEKHRQMLYDFLFTPPRESIECASFLARVLFQPQAERLAAASTAPLVGFAGSICPICESKPQVAVLRPEGDGGKRFLVCSLCLTEWEFRRILCPICSEEDQAKLPRYTAEDVAAVRVEACDSCGHYLKGIDMTIDGLAVPLVDEVATVPLDLWAEERGYKKISLNLMGF